MLGKRKKMHFIKDAILLSKNKQRSRWISGSSSHSFGGLNKLFHTNGSFEVTKIPLKVNCLKQLNDHLLLFYTGIQRIAPIIESDKVLSIDKKFNEYTRMMDLVKTASDIFLNENFSPLEIGALLHESWLIKKSLSDKVTNETIDEIYQTARSAGAIGGKILGAGGGGFMAFLVEPSKRGC